MNRNTKIDCRLYTFPNTHTPTHSYISNMATHTYIKCKHPKIMASGVALHLPCVLIRQSTWNIHRTKRKMLCMNNDWHCMEVLELGLWHSCILCWHTITNNNRNRKTTPSMTTTTATTTHYILSSRIVFASHLISRLYQTKTIPASYPSPFILIADVQWNYGHGVEIRKST